MDNPFVAVRRALAEGRDGLWAVEAQGQHYVRRFAARERLILLGAGHIAVPLCAIGQMLGFAVTVVDDRPDFADTARFPLASQVICRGFAEALEQLSLRSGDYVCIITRGHRWDDVCLRAVLGGTEPAYVGMIGSRRRTAAMLELLAQEGFDRDRLRRVHTPIGLSIGAVTVEEIAVSICAELVQCRRALPSAPCENELAQTNADPALLSYLAQSPEEKALALVLSSRGSTPVKSGSLLAVNAMGRIYGTVGGGCGEAEAALKARRLIGTGRSQLLTVDMNHDVAADEGMVCGGTMTLLLQDLSRTVEKENNT
ncbi:MAG: XdhC family protein [Oscillospiraceae bacterium]|nr:XdhC family protein [Oscillospiraceae bacterium]